MFPKLNKISHISRPPVHMVILLSILIFLNKIIKVVVGLTYKNVLDNINIWSSNQIIKVLILSIGLIIIKK